MESITLLTLLAVLSGCTFASGHEVVDRNGEAETLDIGGLEVQSSLELDRSESIENDFDDLIFVQRWPVTGCITYMDKEINNTCLLPSHNAWTIHGIWPSKRGPTFAAHFCDNSSALMTSALEPIRQELEIYWPNIRKGSQVFDFWEHEWLKHGTCAQTHEPLNTQEKYFGQALEWSQRYPISEFLSKSNIHPGAEYNFASIHLALKSALNTSVLIWCAREKNHQNEYQYLQEIQICLDLTSELIDCRNYRTKKSSVLGIYTTNCNVKKAILYPSHLPEHLIEFNENLNLEV